MNTGTIIMLAVGGLALTGVAIVLYNNLQHRPTFEDLANTQPGQKLVRQLLDKSIERDLESYKHLGEANAKDPNMYFDNKTGLWMYGSRPSPNPGGVLNPNSTLVNKLISRANVAFSFDPSVEEEQLESWASR